MKEIDYSKIPESDIVVNYAVARKKKGLATTIFVTGLPGTGKSSKCIRLGELISIALTGENQITENNVVDSLLGLLEFVRNAKAEDINIVAVEEVSVLFPSRRAMSGDNVSVAKVLDTLRKKEVILIANAPLWTSIDSHMRALGNVYVETLRINKEHKLVISKALRLQTNPGSGKTYFHWFRRKGREVHRIYTKKPKEETWKAYELRKDKFMDDLYDKLKFKTLKKEEKLLEEMGKKHKVKQVKPLSPREMQVYDLVIRQQLTQTDTAKDLGISVPAVNQILKKIKNKMEIAKENDSVKVKITPQTPLNESTQTPIGQVDGGG